ncbi:hypothetical protein CEXT_282661 [Caerostris extrusa]|uniref:Ycf15 n=1 Tax=Caerostris extrusa TaxID=172846 RepID=A0AAV4WBD7_CAEEX|nr:hypothetical protein CEXT_282661 [Caerostris extrusa]
MNNFLWDLPRQKVKVPVNILKNSFPGEKQASPTSVVLISSEWQWLRKEGADLWVPLSHPPPSPEMCFTSREHVGEQEGLERERSFKVCSV